MTLSEVTEAIIGLPNNLNTAVNLSIFTLLKNIGYFDNHEQISEEIIREKLTEQPDRVNEWIVYSENKRSTPGWYFKMNDKQRYIVGYIDPGGGIGEEFVFEDRVTACATFIKKEIEAIRKSR